MKLTDILIEDNIGKKFVDVNDDSTVWELTYYSEDNDCFSLYNNETCDFIENELGLSEIMKIDFKEKASIEIRLDVLDKLINHFVCDHDECIGRLGLSTENCNSYGSCTDCVKNALELKIIK